MQVARRFIRKRENVYGHFCGDFFEPLQGQNAYKKVAQKKKKTVNIYANISSTIVLWCGSIYLSTRPPGFDLCCPGRHGPFAASERSGCVVVGACMGIMISHHAWGIYGNMEGISVTGVCWWFIHTSNWHISLYNYSYTYIYIYIWERERVKNQKKIYMNASVYSRPLVLVRNTACSLHGMVSNAKGICQCYQMFLHPPVNIIWCGTSSWRCFLQKLVCR